MDNQRFVGVLLRFLRLQRNWSQETLCHGICAVSYLSKIEQGKVDANPQLLRELFSRLDVIWQVSAEAESLREELYEGILSWDRTYTQQKMAILEENWDNLATGPCYGDFMVIRAYYYGKPEWIAKDLERLLDNRQRALLAIARDHDAEAYRIYPCPLTAFCVGEEAYLAGNYTQALEYFQLACDQASREGYAYLIMYCQAYMVNCYTDIGNLDAMHRHGKIAARLGRILGDQNLVATINYNIAATKVEFGDYVGGYNYFARLETPEIMDLHKLAICCEALGKNDEAFCTLERAAQVDAMPLQKQMCDLVRYRLENPAYLHDSVYGDLLMDTFERIREELHFGYARFHLRWVTQWLTANRQYRSAFELLQNFPKSGA